MFTKRRVRFSISAMLVVMAAVAVLLNREVQRAKAIETTVKRIEEWKGKVEFRRRSHVSDVLAMLVPHHWTHELDRIAVALYSKEEPPPNQKVVRFYWQVPRIVSDYAAIDSHEFESLLDLGALDNLREAELVGTAINFTIASQVCKSPRMERSQLYDVALTNEDVENLKKSFPNYELFISSSAFVNDR